MPAMDRSSQLTSRFASARSLCVNVGKSFARHQGLHFAAGAGLRTSLALFPLLLAIVTLMNATGNLDALSHALKVLARTEAIPGESLAALRDQLDKLDEPTASQLVGGVVALALGIWSAGSAIRTISAGLNECLGFREHRSMVHRITVSVLLAACVSTLSALALFAVVFGDGIGDRLRDVLGSGSFVGVAWEVLRAPLTVALVVAHFSLVYALAPADRQQLRWLSPGLVVAVLLWFVFAFAFSAYTDQIARGGSVYGAFAGLIALQLYLYWSAAIVLLGAEIDREIGARGSRTERVGRRLLRWARR